MGVGMPSLKKIGDGKYELDLQCFCCPYPQMYTAQCPQSIKKGEVLVVYTDNPPSCDNIKSVAERNGSKVVAMDMPEKGVWRIVIER